MRRTEDTIEVKYKGVPFFVTSETEDGGRKVAIHEYPGANHRFVEDLGKKPGIFRLNGYVGGENWVSRSRNLSTVLDQDSEGILELSVFGIVKVKAQTYTKTVKQTAVGRVDFNITFLVSVPSPSPSIAIGSIETVATAAIRTMDTVEENVAATLEIPTEVTEVEVSEYDGVQLSSTIAEKIAALGGEVDNVTGFANDIRDNISSLVRDPVAYAASMFNDGLLGSVFDNISVSRDTLKALSKLVRVGYSLATDFESIQDNLLTNAIQSFDIPFFTDNTAYRKTNNKNRLSITAGTRTALFATYLNQAARNDYLTDSEINDVVSDIEDAYQNVILVIDTDPIVALALDQCRIEALKVLENKIQTTPKVVDIKLKSPTVDVELAYRLYAEEFETVSDLTDKATVLTDLNDILPTRYAGEVQVLKV